MLSSGTALVCPWVLEFQLFSWVSFCWWQASGHSKFLFAGNSINEGILGLAYKSLATDNVEVRGSCGVERRFVSLTVFVFTLRLLCLRFVYLLSFFIVSYRVVSCHVMLYLFACLFLFWGYCRMGGMGEQNWKVGARRPLRFARCASTDVPLFVLLFSNAHLESFTSKP